MSNKVITISREFGSGGRTIGKQLAAKLGIPCYDSELLEKIAEQSGFAKEYIAEHGEYAAGGSWLAQAFSYRDNKGHSYQDDLWGFQQKVITELAEQGSCVIVGRCADYILKDKSDCLRVFICSDMESRAKRIVEQYGERSDSPEKRLKDKDKRRAAYYQFYTDLKWGDAENYHITLNSGELGIDKCVHILAELYYATSNLCPNCDKHCHKSSLRCPRGKVYFGIKDDAHKPKNDLSGDPEKKMLTLMMQCGRFVHHDVDPDDDTSELLNALSADERKTVEALLEKCLTGWKNIKKKDQA